MKLILPLALLCLPLVASAALSQPWQKLSNPTARQAATGFASPPPEYSAQFTWGWGRNVTRESIGRDLDGMKALGVYAAIIEPKAGLNQPYLSPGYFELVGTGIEEARKRGMKLWIMDDGDYPSGLAGGKFTMERPELQMQALGGSERIRVAGGMHFSRLLTPDVVCVVADNLVTHDILVLEPVGGKIEWTAPPGDWEVVLTGRVFRSLPTRSANNPTGAKDNTHSLMDYLSPDATKQFQTWMFDSYVKVAGKEFGKTVLGFRGDEPAFTPNPWTPKLFPEFLRRKGYDLRPYVASFAGQRNDSRTEEQRRAYADYCDVWSDLFRDNYFNMEGRWCADHGVEMQLHIEHEEILPQLAVADGDYFKCFRNIEVPGIDIIWHQVWMDNPADFPKLASSAAHLYGHPRAMCEAFAAYQPPPNLKQARWLLDFLMVHGISRIEYMAWSGNRSNFVANAGTNTAPAGPNSAQRPRGGGGIRYYREPGFPAVAAYVNRASYLLGEGRPAAQIGLYIPSSSFWLGDAPANREINTNLVTLAHELLAQQRDFDFVDEQALASVLKLKGNELVNLSGQGYRAIIVPPALAISRAALDCLRAFAAAGGQVIFIGAAPALVVDKTFLHATGPADIRFAALQETNIAVTPAVLDYLPRPDLALKQVSPLVSYNHRHLRDAEVYFIFNSSEDRATLQATLAGSGKVQLWDANTGRISPLTPLATAKGTVDVSLEIEPWSTAIVVVGGHAIMK